MLVLIIEYGELNPIEIKIIKSTEDTIIGTNLPFAVKFAHF